MTTLYRLLLIFLFGLTACHKSSPGDQPVAKVGDRTITGAQLSAYFKLKRISEDDKSRRARMRDEYLQREALADVIEQQDALDKQATAAELREFQKEMLISRYFEKFLDDKSSEKAIENYYTTHGSEFTERKVHVAHILFRLNAKMSDAERGAKRTAAQDAYSQLQAGKDFGEIARAQSEDTISGRTGGDLGWMREGSVDPAFSKQVFAMKKGDLSQPFETQFGYHIVKCIEPPQDIKKPLAAVQGDIRYQLRNAAKAAEMERLAAKAKVELLGGEKPAEKSDKGIAPDGREVANRR